MANETLIAELDRLREIYTQRQKISNGLLGALKTTTSALGKTGRALRDYSEQNGANSSPAIVQAQQAFGELRLKDDAVDPLLPELRRETKALAALTGALKDAVAAQRGDSIDVVKLGKAYAALQSSKLQDQETRRCYGSIQHKLPIFFGEIT